MTNVNNKAQEVILDRFHYVYYPVQFWKDKSMIWGLINFGSKVNTITPTYTTKLGLKVWRADVGAQKIDTSLLATYGMVIATF